MIFYFSGTGNSYYVARETARKLGERLVSISSEMSSGKMEFPYDLKENEAIGFVFPVYAWSPPKMVTEFIERLKLSDARRRYVFAAAVCGDEAGNSMKLLERSFGKAGLELNSAFSVTMPNNYIVLFDVDSKEVEQKKLEAADKTIEKIVETATGRKSGIYQIHKGPLPGVKTALFGTLFNRYAISTKNFYSDDKCTGCGICEKVCCCGSITVDDGKPKWGSACTQCLACLHYCPVKAIQISKASGSKGRYVNPNVELKEMLKR